MALAVPHFVVEADGLDPWARNTKLCFGKHEGKVLGSLPVPCLRWMATELHCGWGSNRAKSPRESLSELVTGKLCHTQIVDADHESERCVRESLSEEIRGQLGPETDIATYAFLLRRCSSAKALSEGERVHEHMIGYGYAGNILLSNLALQMYSKCGSLEFARTFFDKIVHRNLYSWTIMITACAQKGYGEEALLLFAQMQVEGFQPNKITFICILDACGSVAALKDGREIHATIVRNGWELDIVVGTALLNMYGKCRSIEDSKAVFAEMPLRDVVSWNAMIAACAQNQQGKEALQLFDQMQAARYDPNIITFVCALDACGIVAALEEGREIHATIVGNGLESDIFVGTALVNIYGKCMSLEDSMAVFAGMPQRNLVSWSAMIAACAQNGLSKEALHFFAQMQAKGVKPNQVTFICIVDACASVAALEQGQAIHATIVGNERELNVPVGNALINMYGKCGNLDDSRILFAGMPLWDLVSWSTMIAACAQNGHDKEALKLFVQMQAKGIRPDEVTFICVLTACSHTGLVDEGRQYFASMKKDHGITPSVDHYLCMVDLLGRQGLLDEAEGLIINMPPEHVIPAWLSLLSSCRIHSDVKRAVRVANFVLEVNPRNASPYVLLANIRANACMSDDALIDNGVNKVPGCKVNNRVHELVGRQSSHPLKKGARADLKRFSKYIVEAECV